jgi:hypothetical protein
MVAAVGALQDLDLAELPACGFAAGAGPVTSVRVNGGDRGGKDPVDLAADDRVTGNDAGRHGSASRRRGSRTVRGKEPAVKLQAGRARGGPGRVSFRMP